LPDFPSHPLSGPAAEALERATQSGYRLRSDETAADGVRRVALGRIDSALAHLQNEAGEDPATAIHEARKDLKKLRSVLRLVREPMGRQAFRQENRRYGDAARRLGGARDAEVRLQTLTKLRERYGEELAPTPAFEARLRARRDSATAPREAIDEARAEIAAGVRALDDLDLREHDGFALLAPGLGRSYRRGRKRLRRVSEHPDPASVHEWRKRVKDLWYHLRLARDAWPAGLEGPEQAAHDLADLLGDHHDLTVLGEALSDAAEERILLPAIEARQAELVAEALPLGRRLYAEKPKRFVARVARYWAEWQR
jgi:CHAD domain-containing protein